ncbi:MAG: enoyl-CoA hydratase/isomerase family protein [Alphaproteobacteria bacterium]|jgi:2-(1,2-epoxy-1,2-dihydrophenyl)acetyl-CoA isomerase|nr:enoyl-CoA hydratase/isomerase family protein [Alphaproteobacteria bacterium]
MSEDLLIDVADGVARLTFNRPAARNAISAAMMDGLADFLLAAETDAGIRCIVLAGAGGHFMAGGDVRNFAEALEQAPLQRRAAFETRVHRGNRVLSLLQRVPQPVVASVAGFAAGAGLSFVAAADLAIAAKGARFVLAHVHIGASPDAGATYHLPRSIGMKRAKAMALLGDVVDAHAAEAMGLVNRVVADADLAAETAVLARRLADGPPQAMARAKALLEASPGRDLAGQLAAEAEALGSSAASDEFVAGVQAFMQKRRA